MIANDVIYRSETFLESIDKQRQITENLLIKKIPMFMTSLLHVIGHLKAIV